MHKREKHTHTHARRKTSAMHAKQRSATKSKKKNKTKQTLELRSHKKGKHAIRGAVSEGSESTFSLRQDTPFDTLVLG